MISQLLYGFKKVKEGVNEKESFYKALGIVLTL